VAIYHIEIASHSFAMTSINSIRLNAIWYNTRRDNFYSRQAKHQSIPWPRIVGMRNRLIHGYDQVDLDILWDTIEYDLPPLIIELEKILETK